MGAVARIAFSDPSPGEECADADGSIPAISQNALAARADVNQSSVSALEKDPWNPTISTLLRISRALNVDLGAIITKAEKRFEKGAKR